MNPAVELEPTWSPRRWWAVVLVLFLGHLAVIRFLGRTPPPPEVSVPSPVHTVFASIRGPLPPDATTLTPPPVPTVLTARDLQSHGSRGVGYPMDDAAPAKRWLGIDSDPRRLGTLPPEPRPAQIGADAPLPDLPDTRPVRLRVANRTLVSVQGSLQSRPLLAPIPALEWAGPEPVLPTVTEVIVNAAGRVISARIIESSGNKVADATALDASRKARFQSIEGIKSTDANLPAHLAWGRIAFRWGLGAAIEPATR